MRVDAKSHGWGKVCFAVVRARAERPTLSASHTRPYVARRMTFRILQRPPRSPPGAGHFLVSLTAG